MMERLIWVTIQHDGIFYPSFEAQSMADDLVHNQRVPRYEAEEMAREMFDALLQYPEDLL